MNPNFQHIIDITLFERLANGDEDAFAAIVHTIYKRLFPFAVSLVKSEAEADDLMQEVFLKIWLHRTEFTHIENPVGWIHTVVANTAANHIRSQLRREQRNLKFQLQTEEQVGIEDHLDAKFTQSLIDDTVSLLPAKKKQVYLLSRREGLSRKEIAARLNISENTVRNQLSEAIQFIRNQISQKGDWMVS